MGVVIVDLSVSLDGFVAGANDGPDNPLGDGGEGLFTWMNASEANRVHPYLAPPDASKLIVEEWMTLSGAIISGRRTFDIAGGWKEGHPVDAPIFVVTHDPPTEGEWSPRSPLSRMAWNTRSSWRRRLPATGSSASAGRAWRSSCCGSGSSTRSR